LRLKPLAYLAASLTYRDMRVRLTAWGLRHPETHVSSGAVGVSGQDVVQADASIAGRRVMLLGKLASMPRRDAEQLVRVHGGVVVESIDDLPNVVVASDDATDIRRLASVDAAVAESLKSYLAAGDAELIGESALWARLGLVDSGGGVERLYTAAMLAELVRAPVTAIRQWHRRGAIVAKREIRRLSYFDFEEVPVARKLAQLLAAGCSAAAINRKLGSLQRLLPNTARPLADPAVVVEGRRLVIRRDDGLAEPSGQLLIEFDGAQPQTDKGEQHEGPAVISMVGAEALHRRSGRTAHPHVSEDLRALAAELEGAGQPEQAIDAYRAVLFAGEVTADDHFALAELLYQSGDLSAARERYYVAIELDEDFVEARSNLGCVLGELGESGLAEAAFRGALEYHPDYADAHYHLARLLDRANRAAEAASHWRLFLNLAPASPWADEARERLEGAERDKETRRQGDRESAM
jgi:tetratricopeptide (TPR) repeat protein